MRYRVQINYMPNDFIIWKTHFYVSHIEFKRHNFNFHSGGIEPKRYRGSWEDVWIDYEIIVTFSV